MQGRSEGHRKEKRKLSCDSRPKQANISPKGPQELRRVFRHVPDGGRWTCPLSGTCLKTISAREVLYSSYKMDMMAGKAVSEEG